MALEVPLRVIEKQYKTRDGEERTSREIKFWDLGFEQFVIVEKLFDEPMTFEGEKDGKKWKINKTMVKYKDEEVNVNISESSLPIWNKLPLGSIRVSKQEKEGKMGTYTTYKFEQLDAVQDEVQAIQDVFPGSEIVSDQSVPF